MIELELPTRNTLAWSAPESSAAWTCCFEETSIFICLPIISTHDVASRWAIYWHAVLTATWMLDPQSWVIVFECTANATSVVICTAIVATNWGMIARATAITILRVWVPACRIRFSMRHNHNGGDEEKNWQNDLGHCLCFTVAYRISRIIYAIRRWTFNRFYVRKIRFETE